MLAHMHAAGAARFGTLPGRGRSSSAVASWSPRKETTGRSTTCSTGCCRSPAGSASSVRCERVVVDAPEEPPARLHGDLWSGNVLADRDGRPWLIDPAAYGGHREMDLAMLELFGSIPARTAAAYGEVAPLADGWRERIPLWQLFPLLVHAVLFGGGYLQRSHDLAVRLSR